LTKSVILAKEFLRKITIKLLTNKAKKYAFLNPLNGSQGTVLSLKIQTINGSVLFTPIWRNSAKIYPENFLLPSLQIAFALKIIYVGSTSSCFQPTA